MPFYLYGTLDGLHLDHIYLRAPNIQLTAGNVELSCTSELASEDLKRGMIAIASNIHEDWMQPFAKTDQLPKDGFFFRKDKSIHLKIYKDPYDAIYDGNIDLERLTTPVAEGEVTLTDDVFVDSEGCNRDSTYEPVHSKKSEPSAQSTSTVPKKRKADTLPIAEETNVSLLRIRQQCHIADRSAKEIQEVNPFKSTHIDEQIANNFSRIACSE